MSDANAFIIGAGAIATAALAIIGFAALIWKLVLPWLRTQLVDPMQEVQYQVKNDHKTNLREDVDGVYGLIATLIKKVDGVDAKVDSVDAKASRIGRQLDAHLSSAAAIDQATSARLTMLENR